MAVNPDPRALKVLTTLCRIGASSVWEIQAAMCETEIQQMSITEVLDHLNTTEGVKIIGSTPEGYPIFKYHITESGSHRYPYFHLGTDGRLRLAIRCERMGREVDVVDKAGQTIARLELTDSGHADHEGVIKVEVNPNLHAARCHIIGSTFIGSEFHTTSTLGFDVCSYRIDVNARDEAPVIRLSNPLNLKGDKEAAKAARKRMKANTEETPGVLNPDALPLPPGSLG